MSLSWHKGENHSLQKVKAQLFKAWLAFICPFSDMPILTTNNFVNQISGEQIERGLKYSAFS